MISSYCKCYISFLFPPLGSPATTTESNIGNNFRIKAKGNTCHSNLKTSILSKWAKMRKKVQFSDAKNLVK